MKPTDRKLKQVCKELFFRWRTSDEIIKETGVNKNTLGKWIYGNKKHDPEAWQMERATESQRFIRESIEVNSRQAHGVVRLGFKMVENALIARAKQTDKDGRTVPLNIKEARNVTEIITSVDKLMRLAEGEPTEILETRNEAGVPTRAITIVELREAFKKDPFMKAVIPTKETIHESRGNEVHQESTITDDDLEGTGIESGSTSPTQPRDTSPESNHERPYESGESGDTDD